MKKPKMQGHIKNRLPVNMENYHFKHIRIKAMLSRREVAGNVGFSQHTLMRYELRKVAYKMPIHFVYSLIQKIEETYGHDKWAYFIKWFNDKYPGYEFYPYYGVSIDDIKKPIFQPKATEIKAEAKSEQAKKE